jgi:DNA-binding transcriptional LysR family regulator
LDRAHRPWRIAYTCGSLAGSIAAVKAGLGITVLPKDMVPSGLHVLDGRPLPNLKDTEIALLHRTALSIPARRLMEHVIKSLG